MRFVSTEMVKYGEFIQAFANPTSFTVFGMEPLIGSSLLAVESGLVFSMIDCMFGGKGTPLKAKREFTRIELGMMRRLTHELLGQFEKAWESVFAIRVVPRKVETKPDFVHLVSPDELMIVIVFSLSGEAFAGNFHFCVSYRMLEPIKDKLSSRYLRSYDLADPRAPMLEWELEVGEGSLEATPAVWNGTIYLATASYSAPTQKLLPPAVPPSAIVSPVRGLVMAMGFGTANE